MKRSIKVKPGKTQSTMGFVTGLIFVGIGLFVVIPTFGPFGIFWTLIAVAITAVNGVNAFGKKGVASHEIVVEEDSYAEGRSIRSVLWPAQGMVTEVCPPCGECFVPDGKTVLSAGDKITFECVAASEEDVKDYLKDIVLAPEK